MGRLALLLLCFLAAASAHAAGATPVEVVAHYRVFKDGLAIGTTSERFQRQGTRYDIESTTTASGLLALLAKDAIVLKSRGEVTATGLRPAHFEHHRGKEEAKRIVADFDWTHMRVTHRVDGEETTSALTSGTQDRISQLYQFLFAPPPNDALAFSMSNGREVSLYRYRVLGEEKTETALGTLATLHLVKAREGEEKGTELWLSIAHRHFPVRIVIEDKNGSKLEQRLTALSIKPGG